MVIDKDFLTQLESINFFDEENRDGTIVSKETKKLWAVELDLLRELIRVCDKYNLRYFLDSGSLLGAVRHKGFIPWDDDIDIVMLRDDYDKLLQIAPDEFKEPYEFQSAYHIANYHRTHVQIRNTTTTAVLEHEQGCYDFNQGIFIDVFPLDVIPDDAKTINKFMRHTFMLSILRRIKNRDFSNKHMLMRRLSPALSVLIPKRLVAFDKYENYCKKHNGLKEGLIDKFTFREGIKRKMYFIQANWYNEWIMVPFEMFNVVIPKEYDNILTSLYGSNYMTPLAYASDHGHVLIDFDKPFER